MTAYDTNNPFAKILRGEFPCYKVYENDHVLAFLVSQPKPLNGGFATTGPMPAPPLGIPANVE